MASSITRTKPGGTTAVPRATDQQPYIDTGTLPPTGYAPPNAQFNPQYGARFAGDQLPGLWSNLQSQSGNAFDRAGVQGLQGFFENQGWPGSTFNNVDQQLNQATHNEQLDQIRNFISGNQGFWPAQAGNLTHLARNGLPGSQQLQQEQQQLAGLGGGVLGGQGGQYGVLDLLSQIFSGGLPNQRGVESLFGPQSQLGQGAQQSALEQFQRLQRGGQPGGDQVMQALLGLLSGQPQAQQQAQGIFSGLAQGQPRSQQQAENIFSGMSGDQPQLQQLGGNVLSGLAGYTPGIQNTASSAIEKMIQGGGLSPEYVAATRRQVLDPSREQLLGNINQMSGGGSLSSPAYQELLRKQESDFNDQLVRAGMSNLQGFLGQGLQAGGQQFGQQQGIGQALGQLGGQQFGQQFDIGQALAGLGGQQFGQQLGAGNALAGLGGQQFGQQLGAAQALGNFGGQQFGQQFDVGQALAGLGQQGIGNALQAYGIVPQSVAPFANLGTDLGTNLLNQSLQRFGTGNQLGLQNLSTIQGLSQDPLQFLQNSQFGGADRQLQLFSQLLNSGLQHQGQTQAQGLSQQGNMVDILRSILSGEYGNEQSRALQSQANRGMWGNIIGAGLGAVPGIGGLLAGLFR